MAQWFLLVLGYQGQSRPAGDLFPSKYLQTGGSIGCCAYGLMGLHESGLTFHTLTIYWATSCTNLFQNKNTISFLKFQALTSLL